MKNMKSIFALVSITSLVAVMSCQKLIDDGIKFNKSNAAFSATPSTTSVAVAAKDSLKKALTFTWTDPKYPTGLSNTNFTVYADIAGGGFKNVYTKTFTDSLSGSFTGKEINEMALLFGGSVNQQLNLEMKVVASLANFGQPKTSNVVAISVTPYGDLSLSADSLSVVCTAANSGNKGSTFLWTPAFTGYNGTVTYQLQYALKKNGFGSPVSVGVTSFNKTFTKLDLNKIAGAVGVTPGAKDTVDFRISATSSAGKTLYSNTVAVIISTFAAYNSIDIIGDATPGGWGTGTEMYRPDPVNNPANWTVTLKLIGGNSAKFRTDQSWTTNWGASAWPTGTGTQGGNNIPVASSGWYQINFNAGTGVYGFTLLSPTTYANISLIGDFNSWGGDDDLTADASGHIWTGTVSIAGAGGIKFRANHGWTTSWGSSTFPSGYSSTSGGNINITAGNYFVYFNDVSGEFFFGNTTNNPDAGTPYGQIGLIGDSTPGGWSTDSFMIQNPANPYKWSLKIALGAGGAKFRANGAWTTNWGNTTFPNGIGTLGGANIAVTPAGDYAVTFNSATGEYTFTQ
ncbi:MAG: hypothetical protein OJF59_000222 [Cytophagales bacterium]|jgi:hypothetical protein|nr:MAG: hypothetical protein OJF59_000222 [Cytophagales bacterium]